MHLEIGEKVINFHSHKDSLLQDFKFDNAQPFYNYPLKLRLPYYNNHLTFFFSAIDWNAPYKIKYSYRIKELEGKWSKPSEIPFANYRNLPYGKHTFEVRAIGESQQWGEAFEYSFLIQPPWWHTWWARTLYLISVLIIIISYVKWKTASLKKRQKILEEIVEERTLDVVNEKKEVEKQRDLVKKQQFELQEAYQEIQVANEELIQTQEEISTQRDALSSNNKILVQYQTRIDNSMKAAQIIQNAMLPSSLTLGKYFKDNFVINLPKDIVSGDFFWVEETESKIILVVADCTGHGVPGAFMTLIGNRLLDKIININKVTQPADILTQLHQEVKVALKQDETKNNNGMDLVVLTFEPKEDKKVLVEFAGAKNDLLYYNPQQQQLVELRGTRKAIGGFQPPKVDFKNHTILLPKDSLIYVCSDGLKDQNNINRKKFGKAQIYDFFSEHLYLPLEDQKNKLLQMLDNHMQDVPQRDDILMVGVQL